MVTGGASGIGRGISHALAEAGAHVVVADVDADGAEKACDELRSKGARALAVRTDVTSPESVANLVAAACAEFDNVDIVCNNAGVYLGGPMRDVTLDDWRFVLSVNLDGLFLVGQAFAALLRKQARGGHIVNTASVGAFLPAPTGLAYAASKYGALAYSESLRIDLAPEGIGVSTLCPGPIRTNLSDSEKLRSEDQHAGGSSKVLWDMISEGWDPLEIGPVVLEGIRNNAPYIFTHDFSETVGERFDSIMTAFGHVR